MSELTLNDQCLAKTLGSSHPTMATPRYGQEPVVYLEELNDADHLATPLDLGFEELNRRVAGNAYKIYE